MFVTRLICTRKSIGKILRSDGVKSVAEQNSQDTVRSLVMFMYAKVSDRISALSEAVAILRYINTASRDIYKINISLVFIFNKRLDDFLVTHCFANYLSFHHQRGVKHGFAAENTLIGRIGRLHNQNKSTCGHGAIENVIRKIMCCGYSAHMVAMCI